MNKGVTDLPSYQQQARAASRLIKRLHVRGLVVKIPRTRRWRITTTGQQLLGAILQLHYHALATAA